MQDYTETHGDIAHTLYADDKIADYNRIENGVATVIVTHKGNHVVISTEMWEGAESLTWTAYCGDHADGDEAGTHGFGVETIEQAADELFENIDRY